MSIVVEHLSKNFANQKAVDDVSFEGRTGRILGFLGPNGAGKSTTMRMLTGYLAPNKGNIKIAGFDIRSAQIEAKKNIGYLPENTPLYTEMYVKEFLTFVGQTYKLQNLPRRIAEVIKMVGLTPEQHKKIGTLSKGYRQRVGLAQAILHDPKVLILDEPTTGLDPNQLVDIRKLIKDLAVNKTVILSTHIMQEVEAICDDVIIITKGKIVANAPLDVLKKQFAPLGLEEIFKKLTL
ncbi:ATP-binding cassette domain-containing protein [Pedobacter sp. UYP30]|uniref:ATP-binding cassette domain-containing protein n=1 Tax=Pedobacter sp. UYP30 TaxID=1756400 RepID=UPI003393FCE8